MLSETFYADVKLEPGSRLPMPDDHEDRSIYIVEGSISVAGQEFGASQMMVFRPGDRITVAAGSQGARLMILGGATLSGPRYIWWNFVASSQERIEAAKAEWRAENWGKGPDDRYRYRADAGWRKGEMTHKWPHLDYLGWRETCSALHLYLQIVGKYRLAHSPWLNHSWNATFYVTPLGLTSAPIPDGPGIEIVLDLRDHMVVGTCGNGRKASFPLGPTTVAAFRENFLKLIADLGGTPTFSDIPNEVPNPVRFSEDHRDRPYDREAVHRYHLALVAVDRVFNRFRTSFLGKSSPVHLFWGALDLAVTRFSGRRAPLQDRKSVV